MDLLGNLANLKVDTVLSAVDKYVPGAFRNCCCCAAWCVFHSSPRSPALSLAPHRCPEQDQKLCRQGERCASTAAELSVGAGLVCRRPSLALTSTPCLTSSCTHLSCTCTQQAKAYVNNVSELELKVLEATNHDPWGPHGSVMQGVHSYQVCTT